MLATFAVVAARTMPAAERPHRRLLAAGMLLGIGVGGFVDGIVFHQILQWHNMLSSRVPPVTLVTMKYNMVFDGLFHAATWLITFTGVLVLVSAARRGEAFSWRLIVGALFAGWGAFNFVEGLIDHQLLGIHHVHPGANQLAWDLGFLASGVVFAAVGFALIRSARRATAPREPAPRSPALGRRAEA